MNTRNRNRLVLVVIFLMFMVPLVAAVLLQPERFGSDPVDTVNEGNLVQPPVPLAFNEMSLVDGTEAAGLFDGRWVVLHLMPGPCDADCRTVITDLRQIHIGTGRHRDDVAVLLIGGREDAEVAGSIYDTFDFLPSGEMRPEFLFSASLAQAFKNSGGVMVGPGDDVIGSTFIVDPEGNLMLRYPPGYDRADLNKDLKKLLKWSGR